MTWTRARRRPPVTRPRDPGLVKVWELPSPAWDRKPLTGPEAEHWFPWAPILALEEVVVIGKDSVARYVALVPEVLVEEDGKRMKAHAVLWGPADSRLPAEGGTLYRTLAPARKAWEKLTKGRERGDDPREW